MKRKARSHGPDGPCAATAPGGVKRRTAKCATKNSAQRTRQPPTGDEHLAVEGSAARIRKKRRRVVARTPLVAATATMTDRRAATSAASPEPLAWLHDTEAVATWMQRFDLLAQLGPRGTPALVKLRDVLPTEVAEGLFDLLAGMPDDHWGDDTDYGGGAAAHSFAAAAPADRAGVSRGLVSESLLERTVAQAYSALGALHPSCQFTFQLARYTRGHFIEPHDDSAVVELDDAPGQQWTRDIAVIYYLTKGWRAKYGGHLVDNTTGQVYVPEFNSLIAFRVPRWHEVTLCTTSRRSRYSLFGWFLSPDPYPKRRRAGEGRTPQGAKRRKRRLGEAALQQAAGGGI